ncbi:MAG: peptidyl-prolyl cis-trans isomerase [Verrucomicrobiota bacterium]
MRKSFAILLVAALAGAATGVRGEVADGIKAIVHDSIITFLEVEDATAPIAEELRRDYRNQPEVFSKKIDAALDENLERLLQDKLILREFSRAGYNLPESIIDEYVQQRVRDRFGSRATLTKTLAAQGSTFEKYRRQIREQFIIEQMRFANVSREVVVSPHKIETYYLAHTNEFNVTEQVKLRMIYLAKNPDDAGEARQRGAEVLAKLKEGADFAELAGLYSQSADRKQGGARDWEELSKLNPTIADAARKLEVGQFSDVIELPAACYLVKMDDKQAAHTRPLGEVREQIEKILSDQQRSEIAKRWIERMRKKTFVRYF